MALVACAVPGYTADLAGQAEAVYANLVRAAGDDRVPPDLVVRTSPQFSVAFYDVDGHHIVVEPKALSVCAAFGAEAPEAMAALLGHELAHYYLGHAWRADFGSRSDAGGSPPAVREAEEAQADRQAGYYAYLAGYPIAGVMPKLLTAIYRAYGLPDEMEGYPSLAHRRHQAARMEEALRPALWAYEAGKRLLILDRPGDAILAFDRAAQDFPAREVLCAAATARLLAVQQDLTPEAFPWTLPWLLDPRSRAEGLADQVALELPAGADARDRDALKKAEDLLERARLREPEYFPALLALADVSLLAGDLPAAKVRAQAAREAAGSPDAKAAVRTVEALVLAAQGHRNAALGALKALDPALPWVGANLRRLRATTDQNLEIPKADSDESLGGWRPSDRSTWNQGAWHWLQIAPPAVAPLNVYYAEGAGVFALRCVRSGDEERMAVTRPDYGGQTAEGVKLGSDEQTVRKAYGRPQGAWATTVGRYWRYRHIAFLLNDGRVAEWMIY